jgi:hypothetical protein
MTNLAAEKTKRIRILRMDESTVCDVDSQDGWITSASC